MPLTPFVPSIVLHKDLENVPDFDDLAEEAGAEGTQHWIGLFSYILFKSSFNLCKGRIEIVHLRYL